MKEPELAHNELHLVDGFRIKVAPMNNTIMKKYQKRAGRGKNKDFIDKYDYDEYGHYGNLESLMKRLLDKEFQSELSKEAQKENKDLIKAIESALETMKCLKDELVESTKDMELRLMKLQEAKEEKSKSKTDK